MRAGGRLHVPRRQCPQSGV